MQRFIFLVCLLPVASLLWGQSSTPDEKQPLPNSYENVLGNLRSTLLQLKQLSIEQEKQLRELQNDNSSLQALLTEQEEDLQLQVRQTAILSNSLRSVSDYWTNYRDYSTVMIQDLNDEVGVWRRRTFFVGGMGLAFGFAGLVLWVLR